MHNRFHLRGYSLVAMLLAGAAACPALAGDKIIYEPAPSWVDVTLIELNLPNRMS